MRAKNETKSLYKCHIVLTQFSHHWMIVIVFSHCGKLHLVTRSKWFFDGDQNYCSHLMVTKIWKGFVTEMAL
jgi:hypothetical protein